MRKVILASAAMILGGIGSANATPVGLLCHSVAFPSIHFRATLDIGWFGHATLTYEGSPDIHHALGEAADGTYRGAPNDYATLVVNRAQGTIADGAGTAYCTALAGF